MREKQILYQNGDAWVHSASPKMQRCYTVMVDSGTHSKSDSAYALTDDGLSLAKARCDYLAKRNQ